MDEQQIRRPGSRVETLLMGRDKVKIDLKGRVVMPRDVRLAVGTKLVLTVGPKGCLELTSYLHFDEKWDLIQRCVISEARSQYAEETMGNSYRLEADESGRFVIPQDLCDEGKIKRGSEIWFIGVGDKAEIWDLSERKVYDADRDAYNKGRRERIESLRKAMIAEGAVS